MSARFGDVHGTIARLRYDERLTAAERRWSEQIHPDQLVPYRSPALARVRRVIHSLTAAVQAPPARQRVPAGSRRTRRVVTGSVQAPCASD